jgi:V8-like Glu-specific endopeptidase
MSISSIGNITNTLSELNFDKESKKEEIDSEDEELDIEELSNEKTIHQAFDMRFNFYELEKRSFDPNLLNRMKKQAYSIACIVPWDKFGKDSNYSFNKEYVWDGVPNLNKRIEEKYKSPLGKDQIFWEEPSPGDGTAFLVCDKRTVLTAAHCLCEDKSDEIDSKRKNSYRLVFNFQIDEKGNYKKRFKENEIYTIKKVIAHYNCKTSTRSYGDWALLKLDREVVDGMPLDLDFSDIVKGRSVYMLGHPSGLPLKAAIHAEIKKEEVIKYQNLFESNIDGFSGNSGSPLFDEETGKVVGLYISGNADYDTKINETTGKLECRVHRITSEEQTNKGYEKCQKINSIFFIPLYMNYLSYKSLLSWTIKLNRSLEDSFIEYGSPFNNDEVFTILDNNVLDKEKIETFQNKKSHKKTTDYALQIIEKQNFNFVTCLDLCREADRLTDEMLKNLGKLTNLKGLRLSGCYRLTETVMKNLENLTKLTSLDLSNVSDLTDIGLKSLGKLTKLRSLNLSECRRLTDTGLKSLEKLTNLTLLDLSQYVCGQANFNDIGLKSLEKLTNLTSLDLSNLHYLTDTGLKSLEKLTNLTSLDLRGCRRLTDTGLKSLEKLANLRSFNLFIWDNATDKGLKSLEKLTSLRLLRISLSSEVTETGLKSLGRLTNLGELTLFRWHHVTDEGLKSLETLTNLTSLELAGDHNDQVTDTGLKSLEKLTKLGRLKMDFGNDLTRKAVLALKNKRGIQ